MPEVIGHQWSVAWRDPYTAPPDGLDRVQLVIQTRRARPMPPQITEKLDELGGLGTGWTAAWAPIHATGRQLSENQKRRLRRTKLMNRLKKQHPLFADQFYEEALRKKPDYYGVTGMKTLPKPK